MNFKIDSEIKNGFNKKVYLLFGEEEYLVTKYKNLIIQNLIPNKEDIDSVLTKFDGDKTEALYVIEATQMMSFFGGTRVVLCVDTGFFRTGKANESDIMNEFLKKDEDDFIIIFIEKDVDKRSKLYKTVQKVGFAEEFTTLKTDDMIKFVVKTVNDRGLKISNNNASYLVFNSLNKMENILTEIDKLTSYKLSGEITKEDIDTLLSKSLEVRIFELVEKIGQKDSKGSIEIFNNMILVKESPIMILTMIGRQFKILLLCKTLLENGLSAEQIAVKTKLHPFAVKKTLTATKNFKKLTLYNALFDCVETDEKIKTGKIKDTIGVETIILKYTM